MVKSSVAPRSSLQQPLNRALVVEAVGRISDAKVAAIIATGASLEELEEAIAWVAGESDVMSEQRLRASAAVGEIYDILIAEEEYEPEREP